MSRRHSGCNALIVRAINWFWRPLFTSYCACMYVYILASKSRSLYVGVTNNLERRMFQHINGMVIHTEHYRINRLVYFERHDTPMGAIEREKRIKALLRSRKIELIETGNPAWDDLAAGWFKRSNRE